jgi:uncharacterized membrane-anchored protein YitT (DUF2179 family)
MGIENSYRENHWYFYGMITLGGVLFGLSMAFFMVPYHVAPGGISGIAIILNHLAGWPTGVLMAMLEIPIFFLGLRYLGVNFSIKVLYATIMTSFFTFIFADLMQLKMELAAHDLLLAPIFGSVLMGAGLGLIIKAGAATSGSGTIARIINHYSNFTIGTAIGIINSIVILLAWIVFRDATAAMYGLISLYLCSKVTDIIVEGVSYARAAFIISARSDEIADMILYDMTRGATALKGRGLYTSQDREVLLCVVERKEISNLVRNVKAIDRRAFIIITEVYEVLGEGFKPRF